jgi:hypothetical protein
MHTELLSNDKEIQQAGRSGEKNTDQVHWTRYAIRNPRKPKNGTRRPSREIECTETRYDTREERWQDEEKNKKNRDTAPVSLIAQQFCPTPMRADRE